MDVAANLPVAVVTGAATGIGRAVASMLGRTGHSVAVCDIDQSGADHVAATIRDDGGRAVGIGMDVASPAAVSDAVQRTLTTFGTPTSVVCAAGIMRVSPFLELEPAVWTNTLQVNLTGTFLVMQACARTMVESGVPGSMVAVASVAARGPRADASDYAASKAGVVSVVQSAAVALAPYGIRVNAVCPGMVDTPMTQRNLAARAAERSTSPDQILASMLEGVPMGRLASTVEIGAVIRSLLSDDFSYVTGQAVNVDGGLEFD
jgi:NAD(P)-dependent dehydrogenase (short-subunit alcohol dehydrogenase family)